MPAKKIVFLVSEFPVLSETFILNKFLGLLEKGWDTHVLCHRRGRLAVDRLASLGYRIHTAWPANSHFLAFLLFSFVFLRVLLRKPFAGFRYLGRGFKRFGFKILQYFYLDAELILLGPDLIHFEFGSLAVGRTYLKELLDCKMTVSFRGYDLNFSGMENPDYYSEVWKNGDGIHCLGQDLWQRAQKRGCPSNQFHVLIPPAIDVDFFKPNTMSSSNSIRILSVGRLEWKKGYEFALQAVRILKDHDIKFEYRIVGAGQYLEALAFCRHQFELEDCVSFLGALSQKEIRDQMHSTDIFLHPAVTEGFCNAVLEAQAMELPVVCSDAGGLPENVIDGETGFVVPRRNPEALAEKITQLAADADLRKRMGQAGRQRVISQFQLSKQMDAFSDFYRSVLSL